MLLQPWNVFARNLLGWPITSQASSQVFGPRLARRCLDFRFSVISPTRSAAREVSPPPGATQKKAMPCQSQSYICTPSRLKRSHDARLHSYPIRYCTASNLRSKIRSFYYLLQGFVQTES